MKTIEEKRTALLAECATLCPNEHNTAYLEVGMLKRQSMGSVFYWLHVDGLSTIAIHDKATDDHIFAAYRILGLETRDAVAESEDKRHELRTAIESLVGIKYKLESRNTALVAALEEIKKPWYISKIGKRTSLKNILEQYKARCMDIHNIVSNALAANTEKGGVLSPAPVTEDEFSASAYPKKCTPTINHLTETDDLTMMQRLEKRMPPFHKFTTATEQCPDILQTILALPDDTSAAYIKSVIHDYTTKQ